MLRFIAEILMPIQLSINVLSITPFPRNSLVHTHSYLPRTLRQGHLISTSGYCLSGQVLLTPLALCNPAIATRTTHFTNTSNTLCLSAFPCLFIIHAFSPKAQLIPETSFATHLASPLPRKSQKKLNYPYVTQRKLFSAPNTHPSLLDLFISQCQFSSHHTTLSIAPLLAKSLLKK